MKNNKNKAIFTVCNVAYMDKVMVLAESVYKHNNIKLNIFIFDRKRDIVVNSNFCIIHWVEEIGIPNFKSLAFKYTIIELSTALKPWLAIKLLKDNDKVVFFDPDVMIFNNLEPIFDKLNYHPVLLTPHYFTPKMNNMIDDVRLMRFGPYNLGFFGVESSNDSHQFLSWWSDRCIINGFDDAQFGIFTDQKWVSIAPCFFPYIHVLNDPGCNVAYWNLDERLLSKNKNDTYYVNDKSPLLFFHFSSFDVIDPENLAKKIQYSIGNNSQNLISDLANKYRNELLRFKNISKDSVYSYDYMSDGKYISPTLRRAYSSMIDKFQNNQDPFDNNGIVYRFAVKNNLFQRNNTNYIVQGYNNLKKKPFAINFIFLFLRLVLFVIGPNNFMNLSRLFIYLSGYNKNSNMWRF
jgi:hypothetical protein